MEEEAANTLVEADQELDVDLEPTIDFKFLTSFLESDDDEALDDDHEPTIDDDHEPTIDYKRLTSFLEFDDSFLTPWNWNPDPNASACDDNTSSVETKKECIMFQPGSFFRDEEGGEEDTEALKIIRDICLIKIIGAICLIKIISTTMSKMKGV
ncbi:hypothetical protein L3X38_031156 [Prunus dulcis]|uniref:Uncharacterized protein n=2 Tax=Prunus dulcis TaxID=3755 RepID=A0AAD4VD29_PRUDU|nr:hypothetical protein L3X38_031156 [Prunus dulcis]